MLFCRLALILTMTAPGGGSPAASEGLNRCFIDAAHRAKSSVVNIVIYDRSSRDGSEGLKKKAYASGTVITESGIVVTNHHVVTKGNYFQVVGSDGAVFELDKFVNGGFFLSDKKTDIALLKLAENTRLRPIVFSDSNSLRQGEWVLAIGNPYGLRQSITSGIVSYTGRDNIGFTDIEDFIQSDVPINPGNSGGPLVNLKGELVGINTAISTVTGGYQGISFAIPSNIVKQVCRELIKYGRVRRGWLGFIARERKSGVSKGSSVAVESVIKGSPAESAGLKKGDIIRKVDSEPIESLGGLVKSVGNKPVGTALLIKVSRGGKLHDYRLILREKTEYRKMRAELDVIFERYGIEIDENSESKDVIVSFVSPGGLAFDIQKGDIVVSLNDEKVFSMDDFVAIFTSSGRRIRRMNVYRDPSIHTIEFDGNND